MTDPSSPPRPDYSLSPYDPHPPAKTPASNGYIRCPDCETVVEAAGHECGDVFSVVSRGRQLLDAEDRAEFAESLLNRLAFMHGCDRMGTYDLADDDVEASKARNGGWVWPLCGADEFCPFCDAAREVKR